MVVIRSSTTIQASARTRVVIISGAPNSNLDPESCCRSLSQDQRNTPPAESRDFEPEIDESVTREDEVDGCPIIAIGSGEEGGPEMPMMRNIATNDVAVEDLDGEVLGDLMARWHWREVVG